MIGALLKFLPLALLVAGGMKVMRKGERFTGIAQRVAVQTEINEMLKFMRLDAIDGTVPEPAGFSTYLRGVMRVNGGVARDVANDHWGTPYELQRGGNRIYVRSAGPDRAMGTADDLGAGFDL